MGPTNKNTSNNRFLQIGTSVSRSERAACKHKMDVEREKQDFSRPVRTSQEVHKREFGVMSVKS